MLSNWRLALVLLVCCGTAWLSCGTAWLGGGLAAYAQAVPPAAAPPQLVDPALSGDAIAQRMLGLQITPPDAKLLPDDNIACANGTGIIALRCAESFTDAARFSEHDHVIVYFLNQASDFKTLKSTIEATMDTMPGGGRLSTGSTVTMSNKAGAQLGTVSMTCEQESGGDVASEAVCFAQYAPGVVVADAVFPVEIGGSIDADTPPDIGRAEDLETEALLGVYRAIGVGAN